MQPAFVAVLVSAGVVSLVLIAVFIPQTERNSKHTIHRRAAEVSGDVNWAAWTEWSTCSATCNKGWRSRSRVCPRYGACQGDSTAQEVCGDVPCVQWLEWASWSSCSKTCDNGTQTRSRHCSSYGAISCEGPKEESRECNSLPCCSNWAAWTHCSVTCGTGERSRSRRCSIEGGTGVIFGQTTYASKTEEKKEPCTGDLPSCAEWSAWGNYSDCSVSCGGGTQKKKRTCSVPDKCEGKDQQSKACNQQLCAVWSDWTEFAACSASCGGGKKQRTRTCSVAGQCVGNATDEQNCGDQPWGPWAECGASCGGGLQKRGRVCNLYNTCPGSNTDKRECNGQKCPEWNSWGKWGECSVTCGAGGVQERKRDCDVDKDYCAKNAGSASCMCADGKDTDKDECNDVTCPAWSKWQPWTPCSKPCGSGGTQSRQRKCDIDAKYCSENADSAACACADGKPDESQTCNAFKCAAWGTWGAWTECTLSCGGGGRERKHKCEFNETACAGGKDKSEACVCPGLDHSNEQCNVQGCPSLEPWAAWGKCSAECGGGTRQRARTCSMDSSFCLLNKADPSCQCTGETSKNETCNTHKCATWAEWGAFGECSASCGGGERSKSRKCSKDKKYCAGAASSDPSCKCEGNATETEKCNYQKCPTKTEWGEWTDCSVSCGGGVRSRNRTCTTDKKFCKDPANADNPSCQCPTDLSETEPCNTCACPFYKKWGSWGSCTVTCGGGSRERRRDCQIDTAYCTADKLPSDVCKCSGNATTTEPCKTDECYQWSKWGSWATCSVVCGGGNTTRSRKCPVDGGCPGLTSESSICNQTPCPDWGAWSEWASCSVTCGGGSRARTRACKAYATQRGPMKNACTPGLPFEIDDKKCNKQKCPLWTEWTEWSQCGVTCGDGNRKRSRTCNPIPDGCPGRGEDIDPCSTTACPPVIPLSPWSDCSQTCGGGTKTRSKTNCPEGPPKCAIEDETAPCNEQLCPVWEQWGAYTECSASCGGGQRTRKRTCPVTNGCVGQASEIDPMPCSPNPCTNR